MSTMIAANGPFSELMSPGALMMRSGLMPGVVMRNAGGTETSSLDGMRRLMSLLDDLLQFLSDNRPAGDSQQLQPAPRLVVMGFPNRTLAATDASVGRECYICLAAFTAGASVRTLPCGHEFHVGCIDTWLLEHTRTCPACRADVVAAAGLDTGSRGSTRAIIHDGDSSAAGLATGSGGSTRATPARIAPAPGRDPVAQPSGSTGNSPALPAARPASPRLVRGRHRTGEGWVGRGQAAGAGRVACGGGGGGEGEEEEESGAESVSDDSEKEGEGGRAGGADAARLASESPAVLEAGAVGVASSSLMQAARYKCVCVCVCVCVCMCMRE